MSSCENEVLIPEETVHTRMLSLYAESVRLTKTSADSVVNYYMKFAGFHHQHPECEEDELFPPTVRNVGDAFTQYGIVQIGSVIVKTDWDGELHYQFDYVGDSVRVVRIDDNS